MQTNTPPSMMSQGEPVGESILRSLRRISRAVELHSRQLARTYSLTAPQLVCLRHLVNGPCSSGELARAASLSPATISGILDRLESRELVTRVRKKPDKRKVMVALTDAGAAIVRAAPLPLQERFARRLAELTADEQDQIDTTLRRIVHMMEAQELDANPSAGL